MSSKKPKDKFDQIIIETTQIKVNVKTTGDLITKEYDLIPFHPNMSDLRDLSNNSYILFPSFVKITMKDLEKTDAGNDFPRVFLNLEKYIKLIKYVTSPEREEDYTLFIDKSQVKNYAMALAQNSLTDLLSEEASDIVSIQKYEALTEEEIITNNIELIKRLFFPLKGHFFILGNDYVISKSKYIPKYEPSLETNTKLDTENRKIPLAYTVKFEVELLDAANNPGAGDFMKMSCKGKKNSIATDTMDIFGTNFGYVPEKKAQVQSILKTADATKYRQFGKLQKEWEERNKYVKAPTNERERLEQESKWTPLQKKMAQYDKYQEVFNKIPPLWIKERKELTTKFADFTKEIGKLEQDIENIEKSNPTKDSVQQDMINDVIEKMKAAIEELSINVKKEPIPDQVKNDYADKLSQIDQRFKELLDYQRQYTELKKKIEEEKDFEKKKGYEEEKINLAEQMYNLKDVNELLIKIKDISNSTFYTDALAAAKKIIDDKYVKPLLDASGRDSKEKDVAALTKQEAVIRGRINPSDPYGSKSAQVELAKVQGEIRKKKAEIEMINKKFGKDGSVLITSWVQSQSKLDDLGKTIADEKTIAEKKIKVESVNKELDEKLKEIVKLKKDLMLAKFFAGQYDELDKDKFESKAAKERPLESVETLQANLDLAKENYLEIAAKFNEFNKLQAKITLLSSDLTDLKELKDAKKKGKDKKDKEKGDKNKDIGVIEKKASDAKVEKTASDIKQIEGYTKDIELIEKEIAEKYTPILEKTELKIKLYNAYIDRLKKIKQTDDIKTKMTDSESLFNSTEKDEQTNEPKGLLQQLENLIKRRDDAKTEHLSKYGNDIGTLNTDIVALQKNIKEMENASPKKPSIEIDPLKEDLKKKKERLAEINKELDTTLEKFNTDYENKIKKFKDSELKGGRLIRRTRKHRRQKKPSKRYILSKSKIKKVKSSRYRRKKYTLRKR
jgi:hypothetical protein